jgi:Sodium:solute symporter family
MKGGVVGTPALNITIFAFFVLVSLAIAVTASGHNKTTTDYYAGGRAFSGPQNGVAIGGDYLSAASFLGIAGLIALNGYDGFLYSIGFLAGWVLVLLLVAGPLRNTGRYTTGDVLDLRLRAVPVSAAAAVSTLTVSLFYLLARMAGAQEAAAQQAAERRAAEWEAARQRAARWQAAAEFAAAAARGEEPSVTAGDVDMQSVRGLLDDEDDEGDEDAGYGQIMLSMTLDKRRERRPE